jgi:opacity protein-like surface antigen
MKRISMLAVFAAALWTTAQARAVFDAAMQELGFTDMIENGGRYGHSGAVQHRCAWPGCNRFAGGPYCDEHENHKPALTPMYRSAA